MLTPERKAQLLKKYSLKETHGFEKKPEMETDVAEQLRKGHEAEKLQPYHSMVDKAKDMPTNRISNFKESKPEIAEQTRVILKLIKRTDDDGLKELAHYILGDLGDYSQDSEEDDDMDYDKLYDDLVDEINKASSKTITRLYNILKKENLVESIVKLKEEDMKAEKEAGSTTDVEEELRKNYAIGGKLAPYKPISQK